ncbi:MAG: subclass B3 metallo-beta-lactamase [Gemmatimonadota bacterium]
MEPVDAFKLLQQATLGSEHAVRDPLEPARWMTREWASLGDGPAEPLVDTLGANGAFARIHLRPWRATGRAPSEVVTAFVATARTATADTTALRCAIRAVVALAHDGQVRWDADSVTAQGRRWEAAHFPAVDHSPRFEAAYRPAYRVVSLPLVATLLTPPTPYPPALCANCATWNIPTAPFKLTGNSWYVGTRGLSAILITGPAGHILIDGGLPESASQILANVKQLGFNVSDIKLILNSHAHSDHAGGIAAIQRVSGASVAASAASAAVLRRGLPNPDDPQFGTALPYPPVTEVRTFADGDTLRVGTLEIIAHATPGHTPGGTSWSWRSCEGAICRDLVYADSETPVSADDFHFTNNTSYPEALADFERGFRVLERLRCDVLITPHPSASMLWERVAGNRLVDAEACRRYVVTARAAVAKRIATERGN